MQTIPYPPSFYHPFSLRRATALALLGGALLLPGVVRAQAPPASQTPPSFSLSYCGSIAHQAEFAILELCPEAGAPLTSPVQAPEPGAPSLTPCTTHLLHLDPQAALPGWTKVVMPLDAPSPTPVDGEGTTMVDPPDKTSKQ